MVGSQDYLDGSVQPRMAWADFWHRWTVFIPWRSITAASYKEGFRDVMMGGNKFIEHA
jgi:hypothetical protein